MTKTRPRVRGRGQHWRFKRKPVPPRVWRPIAARVAGLHGVSVVQMLWHGLNRPGDEKFHRARRAFWREIRDLGHSLPAIGAISGHHHTTVMHGLRRAPITNQLGEQPCL